MSARLSQNRSTRKGKEFYHQEGMFTPLRYNIWNHRVAMRTHPNAQKRKNNMRVS